MRMCLAHRANNSPVLLHLGAILLGNCRTQSCPRRLQHGTGRNHRLNNWHRNVLPHTRNTQQHQCTRLLFQLDKENTKSIEYRLKMFLRRIPNIHFVQGGVEICREHRVNTPRTPQLRCTYRPNNWNNWSLLPTMLFLVCNFHNRFVDLNRPHCWRYQEGNRCSSYRRALRRTVKMYQHDNQCNRWL